ncbi:Pyridine nucleotide-disulphide oxidoreductase [Modicisalibacter muralis]|uniref:Pyridine nucleotide-disulphide oxidoreductase n=1 Tax=Modicisalibacter muralis TaxID=119000 RepID=A0A1G9G9C2_9GAMM|nr:Pyridine nucleotide-disulphide oxidoreductase [Halomonas muralis]
MTHTPHASSPSHHDVVIIGGGAAGIAVAASLLKRRGDLDIAIIEPAESHYYQPGWTLVGGGVFSDIDTRRSMQNVMPRQASHYPTHAERVDPQASEVTLADGRRLGYTRLVVAPGLVLDWGPSRGSKRPSASTA